MSESAKKLAEKTIKDIAARKKKKERDFMAFQALKSEKTNIYKVRGQR